MTGNHLKSSLKTILNRDGALDTETLLPILNVVKDELFSLASSRIADGYFLKTEKYSTTSTENDPQNRRLSIPRDLSRFSDLAYKINNTWVPLNEVLDVAVSILQDEDSIKSAFQNQPSYYIEGDSFWVLTPESLPTENNNIVLRYTSKFPEIVREDINSDTDLSSTAMLPLEFHTPLMYGTAVIFSLRDSRSNKTNTTNLIKASYETSKEALIQELTTRNINRELQPEELNLPDWEDPAF